MANEDQAGTEQAGIVQTQEGASPVVEDHIDRLFLALADNENMSADELKHEALIAWTKLCRPGRYELTIKNDPGEKERNKAVDSLAAEHEPGGIFAKGGATSGGIFGDQPINTTTHDAQAQERFASSQNMPSVEDASASEKIRRLEAHRQGLLGELKLIAKQLEGAGGPLHKRVEAAVGAWERRCLGTLVAASEPRLGPLRRTKRKSYKELRRQRQ